MSEEENCKSSEQDKDGEDETIDVGTTAGVHLLMSGSVEQTIDSSGSSEESSSRDMSVSQSHPTDSDRLDGSEGLMCVSAASRDVSLHNFNSKSPNTHQELSSPLAEDFVSSPTDASTPIYESYLGRKTLICTLCDYSTNDRSNFKRHKRLHIRSNPVNVLKCNKCAYTTILPRKIREHYRQQHNMVYTCRQSEYMDAPASVYTGPQPPDMPTTFQNLEMTSRQPQTNRAVPVAPSALHSLLTSVGPERIEYGRIHNPNMAQYEPYESHSQALPRVQEPHMASNYLRSIVSTVLPPNPLHRVAATSTITSSSYYLNTAGVSSHRQMSSNSLQNPSLAGMQAMDLQLNPGVKVKQEPVDMVMDTVSSSGVGTRSPEPTRPYDNRTVQLQRHMDPPDSISYVSIERGNEAVPITFSSQPGPSDERRRDIRRESLYQEEPCGSQTHIKLETSSIGVQCAMPVVKTEPVERNVSDNKRRVRGTLLMIERGTQCELIQSTRGTSQSGGQSYGSDSEGSDQQDPSQTHRPCSKCVHCGVTFDDEVLYSIHIGCHSHTDPYVCNVCGKHCHNKYGFYSHIMRGHQC